MKPLRIDVGVCTSVSIDISDIKFKGVKKLVFTIKNSPKDRVPIVERSMLCPGIHLIKITPEESRKILSNASYDIDVVLEDNSRYKLTDNGKIILRLGIGRSC